MISILRDFATLLYPNLCVICEGNLSRGRNISPICIKCQVKLPQTNFHLHPDDNPVTERLWGRVEIRYASAFYWFRKDSPVQTLIHQLKYAGRADVGKRIGKMFGAQLSGSAFDAIDLLIPVPLNPRKESLRGYNQAAMICEGLAEALDTDLAANALQRPELSDSQTHKSREERLSNAEGRFRLAQPALVANRHVLLVDDVITTGATIEACIIALRSAPIPPASISVVAAAIASH